MPPAARRTLRLDDPGALRALAHPARQRIVAALYAGGEPMTATQAAELCGLTPSAMSYHLRALEKWGIVRRADSGDGRERPWAAAADDFSISPNAYRGIETAVANSLVGHWAQEIADAVVRIRSTLTEDEAPNTLRSVRLWLTPAELADFHTAVDAALAPFQDRTSSAHPEGALPADIYLVVAPPDPQTLG